MSGDLSPTTICFIGHVNGCPVQVLLDGGSTYSFVQTRVAKFLNLTVEPTDQFGVLVGNRERLLCSGIAKEVPVSIQGHEVKIDFFVLPLQGWDMVLGVSWLATLGPMVTDYSSSQFEFKQNDVVIKWKGKAASGTTWIQPRSIVDMICQWLATGSNKKSQQF